VFPILTVKQVETYVMKCTFKGMLLLVLTGSLLAKDNPTVKPIIQPKQLLLDRFSESTATDSLKTNVVINIYKHYISPIDGDRCPMYPSCSQYAKEAFHRYGFFKGLILTFDRLLRCGSDLRHYREIRVNHTPCYLDPVDDNVISKEPKR